MFSKQELERYSRHLIIPEFNINGQRKLKEAKVLVVGTGGLGAPLLQYLTAAGVGTIGVVDFDVVEESNLQRQVLFDQLDIGKSKVKSAIRKLSLQNPYVTFHEHNLKLDSSNAKDIISQYDIVADGTDNFPTRYLVNDACVLYNKINVFASIFRFEGQCSVFNYLRADGSRGPNFRDLFPSPPPPGLVPSCAEGGVLGVMPGILGSLQANEVIKVITGIGEVLDGRIFIFDAASFESRTLKIRKNADNPLNGQNPSIHKLIDYEEFCGISNTPSHPEVKGISVESLQQMQNLNEEHVLIDVREAYEYEIANLNGLLIPQGQVINRLTEIPKDKKVVVHCRSGKRSAEVIELLKREYEYNNLVNLDGGILAWADRVDQNMAKY